MLGRLPSRLLWVAHLLSIFLLPGTYVLLLHRGNGGNLPLYVFWTWERLALLLPALVSVWRLWQRRWGQAMALAVLVGVDVLVRYGYCFAFFVSSMAANPT
jgi:hypothetical protein